MIARFHGSKPAAHWSPQKRAVDRRYVLLKQLSEAEMPYRSELREVIDDLITLHAAGLIEGEMPLTAWIGHVQEWSGPAVVHRLTKLGRSLTKQGRI